jgi:hypothetical protein
MFGIAGLADYLHHLPIHQAGNGVIQQQAATGTIVVN